MIVASLLLILVAVVLLVLGLAGGSSLMLIISIAASLLAAVALVVGARQAAANRAAADPGHRGSGGVRATGRTGPGVPYGPPLAEPEVPVQHIPTTVGTDGTGWRQPPEPSVDPAAPLADPSPFDGPDPEAADVDDEPAAQPITPAEAARVARLPDPVHVVDGRPRYHLASCPHLLIRSHEALSVAEAVELGFTPCALCAPATALLADARPI